MSNWEIVDSLTLTPATRSKNLRLAAWVAEYNEIMRIPFYGISPVGWGLLSAALLYAVFGPPVLAHLVERRGNPSVTAPNGTPRIVFSASSLGLLLLAIGFGSLAADRRYRYSD